MLRIFMAWQCRRKLCPLTNNIFQISTVIYEFSEDNAVDSEV